MLLTITLIPLAVAFIFGIAEIVLRTKSHAANLSDIFRILEQMEASGQITSPVANSDEYALGQLLFVGREIRHRSW